MLILIFSICWVNCSSYVGGKRPLLDSGGGLHFVCRLYHFFLIPLKSLVTTCRGYIMASNVDRKTLGFLITQFSKTTALHKFVKWSL
ncbi:hypothetical protein V8C34DRAFT_280237, partial [Trichoderma compactum]